MYPKNMSDTIQSLPTDESSPTHPELKIVDYLFEKDGSQHKINGLVSEFKSSILAAGLFVILSLHPLDMLITQMIPVASNAVILMIIKAIFFMVVFYFIQNFWLVRKKD